MYSLSGDDSDQLSKDTELFSAIRKKSRKGNKFISEKVRLREIKECLRNAANINAVDENDIRKNTVLHIAVRKGYKEIVEYLVNNQADVNIKNSENETPLDVARKQNNTEIINILEGHFQNQNYSQMTNAVITAGRNAEANAKSTKGAVEGRLYEKLSIIFLVQRGYEVSIADKINYKNLAIGREVRLEDYDKLDDMVFKYEDQNNFKNLVFVQIKYKQNEDLINSNILSSDASSSSGMERDFNLQKYFISYLNKRKILGVTKSDMLKDGNIKYTGIFTNTDLDTEELEKNGFRLKKAPDDIIKLFTLDKSQKSDHHYQLQKISNTLHKTLEKSSDLYRLAKEITKFVVYKNYKSKILKIDKFPIKKYHVSLGNKVINKQGGFRDDFINNEEEGSKWCLRDAIFETIRELDKEKENASDDELKMVLKAAKLKLDPSFGKTKQNSETELPVKWSVVKSNDITDFLDSLVFIVKQPSVEDFEKPINNLAEDIVVEEPLLKQVLNKMKNVGPDLRKIIENLLEPKQASKFDEMWITGDQIVNFIQEQKQSINSSYLIPAMTLIYESEVLQYGIFNHFGNMERHLDKFLQDRNKVLCIDSSETLLSSIKVLQYVSSKAYTAEKGRISISLRNLSSKINLNKVVEAFKLEDNKLLTIECAQSVQQKYIEELHEKLYNIIKDKHNKKIILIVDKHQILAEKFKIDFQNTGEYVLETDDINIKDFKPQDDPLEKEVMLFQGQEKHISLGELIGISNWQNYLDELSKDEKGEDIIDASSLVQLLNGDEIIIGSEPPRISSLEGAYAKIFKEINKETFRDKLLSQRPENVSDDLYIISGLNESDKEKSNELIHYLEISYWQKEIENKIGTISSGYKIQIEGDQFKDEQFVRLCKAYPDRKIFWIIVKNENHVKSENHAKNENQLKFILYQFYNPDFYINRKFINNVFITKAITHQLLNHDLSERFIFSGVTDQEEFTSSFRLYFTAKVQQFRNNCINGKITIVNNEQEADCYFQILSKEQGVEIVHWLTFEESRLVWHNSYGSSQNLRKYIDKKFINKVFITKEIKHLLLNRDLSEIFIFSGATDIEEFTKSFNFFDKNKEKQLTINCRIGKIRLVKNEEEAELHFEILSKQQGIKMLHWLIFEESRLVWNNSCRSLENLHKYTDEKQRKESLIEENILIKEIKDKKVVIIADDPGMGKSTTLTRLYESRSTSESILESHWVIRINLRDHLQAIKDIDSENIDVNIVKEFLLKLDLNLNNSIAKNLLRIALTKKGNSSMMLLKPLLIAFDGFDELLDEEDRKKIILLLKFLKNESGVKFWITTRLQYKPTLEEALSTFATEFHPIEEKTQFITKYLKDRMSLILSKESFEEVFGNNNKSEVTTKLKKYINAFSSNMESVFQSSTSKFLGTPLQLYLMLEGSVTYFKNWIENYDLQPPNFDYLGKDILEVYEKFIERKYEIHFNKMDMKEQLRQRQDKMNFDRFYESLAISSILNSEHKKSFEEFKDIVLSTGIVKSQGSIYEFIHPTFREYFAAQLFIHWIEKLPNVLQNFNKQEYLLKEILIKPSYKFIRTFMNIKLKEKIETGKIPEEKIKLYGEIISKLWDQTPKYKKNQEGTILHTAATEDNKQIISFIFNCLEKMVNSQKKIVDFLAVKIANEESALYQAAIYSSNETFELMLNKIKRILSEKQFYRFLRNERIYIFSNGFFRLKKHRKQYLKLIDLAESKLSDEKLCKFLGQTDLHRAVIKNNKDKVDSILNRNVDKEHLFSKDNLKKTVLHYVVAENKYEFTEEILKKAKQISSEDELKSFLCVRDLEGDTVFHIAVNNLNFEITKLILEATKCLHYSTGICEFLRALNDNTLSSESKTVKLKSLLAGDSHTYVRHLYGPNPPI